jgi:hypothetical protein
VRMTKPNFVSSHDWHVQLCCQRSGLHPPKRAALDQGRNRQKARFVSSNLMRCCRLYLLPTQILRSTSCRPKYDLSRITSATSDVLANFSRLSTSTLLVKLFLAPVEFFPKRKLKTDKDSHNAEISKYRNARRRARSLGS